MALFSKNCLGIDIGTFSIKIVELSSSGKKKKLLNYIQFQNSSTASPFRTFGKDSSLLLSTEVAEVLDALLKKAKVKTRNAYLAIPDFSTFFTTFSLPLMTEIEIPQAIEFEAHHRIPLPLSEVTFDWRMIESKEEFKGVKKLKIMLVAIPNSVIFEYQKLANLIGFNLKGIEPEIFGLTRAISWGRREEVVCLVDIGYTSTTISIIEKGILKQSYSFDISSLDLTKTLVDFLNLGFEKAEKIKEEIGLNPKEPKVFQALSSRLDFLLKEIQNINNTFLKTEKNKEIKSIVLAGGSAHLMGLKDYFKNFLEKEIEIFNPFLNISYPEVLKERLEELGPSLSIAVGTALRGVEE